jgi:hypothetical protein
LIKEVQNHSKPRGTISFQYKEKKKKISSRLEARASFWNLNRAEDRAPKLILLNICPFGSDMGLKTEFFRGPKQGKGWDGRIETIKSPIKKKKKRNQSMLGEKIK